ncbi:hypothetical protein DFH07DRAFT_968286 [Mycena maculata]|uniref:60S ribosomal export protein NMD3 n=1 Tax=Mycena maculata TaxID=230809 RepID=A0AAD7I2L0_9AGAR|nr:hypothetical protein DFH07DRAFT_968286 [Mycena maculata]
MARDYSSRWLQVRHTNTTWIRLLDLTLDADLAVAFGKTRCVVGHFLVRLFLFESLTNPLLKIVDIAAISKGVMERAADTIVVINNIMNPYLPLIHQILCADCGAPITPNSTNLCVACLRNSVDITEINPKQASVPFSRNYERFLSAPQTKSA